MYQAYITAALADAEEPVCQLYKSLRLFIALCSVFQRSCDLGLGVPFNIASYSLLTVMIAHVCGLKPGDFVHTLADAHVYTNHVDALKQQLERTPRPFPTLSIKRQVDSIDDFTFDDLVLSGYKPLDSIKMTMAV
jgi:thymidylate synthase